MKAYNKPKRGKGISPFETNENESLPKKLLKNTLKGTTEQITSTGSDFGRDFLNQLFGTDLAPDGAQTNPDIVTPQLSEKHAPQKANTFEIFNMQKVDKPKNNVENKRPETKSHKAETLRQPGIQYHSEFRENIALFRQLFYRIPL